MITIRIYDQSEPRVFEVNAMPIALDHRLTTVVHDRPFDTFAKRWSVSELITGTSIASGDTSQQAIAKAKLKLSVTSDKEIRDAMSRQMNVASDRAEYIALFGESR